MNPCVFCNSTTSDYERMFRIYCLAYFKNIAQFEGGDCEDDELEKYGDDADDIFYFVRRRAYTV